MALFRTKTLGVCCSLILAALISSCEQQTDEEQPATSLSPAGPADIARNTVAAFLSVEPGEVELISLEARDFGNSGLDCAEPDMAYAQVITPGHVVIVEAQGRRFDVRVSGANGRICRAKNSRQIKGLGSGPETTKPNVSLLTELARKDLAKLLGVPYEELRQLDIRPATAANLPTGCRPECPDGSEVCGYLIGINFDSRRYEYHGSNDIVAACPKILPR